MDFIRFDSIAGRQLLRRVAFVWRHRRSRRHPDAVATVGCSSWTHTSNSVPLEFVFQSQPATISTYTQGAAS